MSDQRPAVTTYVVSDVHGHFDELVDALQAQGLLDASRDWAGGQDNLWFLGDHVDRGPAGIDVINLVMRLAEQAEEAGGSVRTLLGNHEIVLLGAHRFGDTQVPTQYGPRSFVRSWLANGGVPADYEGLTDKHLAWLTTRPMLAVAADHLFIHSDTLGYLGWGSTVDEINSTVAEILAGDDPEAWWDIWHRTTDRYVFRGDQGAAVADRLMAQLGGSRIVHGHTFIADQLGIPPTQVQEPYLYAEGKVLAIDGGLFAGGPCLVVPLPWEDAKDAKDTKGAEGADGTKRAEQG